MRTLKFKCAGQKLSKSGDFSNIVPGSKGYLKINVDFDNEWSGFARVAEFSNKSGTYPTLIENGFCNVPDEVTDARAFTVKIIGKKGEQKIITNKVMVRQEG